MVLDLVESGTTQSRRLFNRLFYNSEASNLGTDFRCEPLRMRISRGSFFTFRSIFHPFGPFRPFLGPDFSVFCFFSIFGDGILARRNPPCVSGHAKTVLKQDDW
jgi:hypothetical protein